MATRTWDAALREFENCLGLEPATRASRLERLRNEDPSLFDRVQTLLRADSLADRESFLQAASTDAPGADANEPTLSPGTRVGSWVIVHRIGSGGMGEVYLARRADGSFELKAALKLLKRGMDSEAIVRRFARERNILAQLDHPNIAHVLDAAIAPDGRPCLVMEFVEGQPITDYAQQQELSTAAVLRLMITVCEAVQAAHSRRIIHRDLKPSNVLVTAKGQVKLLDFGIAKALEEEDAESTRLAGDSMALTPAYAAPEQILGLPPRPATDVYALGVILYVLLAERPPHRRAGRSLTEITRGLKNESIPRPSTVLRNERGRIPEPRRLERLRATSRDLDLIVLKSLHAESTRRYADAQQLSDDLQRLLEQRPVLARPDSVMYRTQKFVRRNRGGVLGAGIVIALLLAGAGAVGWEARLAREQAHQATAVKDFLLDVFQQADPTHTQGETITARALLDQGTRRLRSRLSGEPLVQAELFDAIANIDVSLGLNDRALEMAQSSLALRRAHLDPGDERIAQSLSTLGDIYNSQRESVQARDALALAAAIESRPGRGSALSLARIESKLAEAMDGIGESTNALALERNTYQTFVRVLGPRDPETADEAFALGCRLEDAGDYADAEYHYREALAAMTPTTGEEDAEVGQIHLQLGGLLDRLGHPAEADQELQKSITILRKIFGDTHPQLARALFSRALLLIGIHRYADAEATLEETLRIYPAGSLLAAQSQRYLGESLLNQKRYAEARTQLQQSQQTFHALGAPGAIQAYRALAQEANADLMLGQAPAAEAKLREAVGGLERLVGPEAYEVRKPLKSLGDTLMALNRNAEALAVLERVHALEIKLFGSPEHKDLGSTEDLMAEAMLKLHDPKLLPRAQTLADHALVLARRNYPDDVGTYLLIDGKVALAAGDVPAARASLGEAVPALTLSDGAKGEKTGQAKALLQQVGGGA